LKLEGSVPRPLGGFLRPASLCQYCLFDKDKKEDLFICGYTLEKSLNYCESLIEEGKYLTKFQYGIKTHKRIIKIDDKENAILYEIPTHPVQIGSPLLFGNFFIGIHTEGKTI
jgi:hypothetical protein